MRNIRSSGPGSSQLLNRCAASSKHNDNRMAAGIPTIQRFPYELRELLADYCLQSDAFHLSLTCWALYNSTLRRIYERIVLDSQHRRVNKEIVTTSRTFVRTVGGLRGLFRALDERPEYVKLVKHIECYNSLEVPDLEVFHAFSRIFRSCSGHLQSLWWHASPELSVELLTQVSPTVNTMVLDMALRPDRRIAQLHFDRIKHLIVRPYSSLEILSLLARMFASCSESGIETLYLGRRILESHEVGSGYAFAALSEDQMGSDAESVFEAFFGQLRGSATFFPNLKRFGIEGLVINDSNVATMKRHVPLDKLTHVAIDSGEEEFFANIQAQHLIVDNLHHTICQTRIVSLSVTNISEPVHLLIKSLKHQLENLIINPQPLFELDDNVSMTISRCLKIVRLQAPISPLWILSLHHLRYLHYSQEARLPPYLGGSAVAAHTKLAPVVNKIASIQPAVQYLSIEGYIYDLRGTHPVVREGLTVWFERQMSFFLSAIHD